MVTESVENIKASALICDLNRETAYLDAVQDFSHYFQTIVFKLHVFHL